MPRSFSVFTSHQIRHRAQVQWEESLVVADVHLVQIRYVHKLIVVCQDTRKTAVRLLLRVRDQSLYYDLIVTYNEGDDAMLLNDLRSTLMKL